MKESTAKKLTLDKSIIRTLTPDETDMVGGATRTSIIKTIIETIDISIHVCTVTVPSKGGGCGPGDTTVTTTGGGETAACGG